MTTAKRKSMTPARKQRIWEAHDGKCWRCKQSIEVDKNVVYDHKVPLALGGSDDDENIGPSHADTCDKLKTFGTKSRRLGADIFEIAKTKRIKKKHSEPRKSKYKYPKRSIRNPMFKKKVDGTVVRRESK